MKHSQHQTNANQQHQSGSPFSAIANVFSAIGQAFRAKSETQMRDEYLAESTDIYDLEARMRAWDRRQAKRGHYPMQ